MARRNDHARDELETLILAAASRLVEEKGFEGLTARAVAKEIGYAPGTIYNLFSSMDGLSLALNARTLEALAEVLNGPSCHNPDKTPMQNMKAMAQLYYDFAHDNRGLWLMLFMHRLPEGEKLPDWYQKKIDSLFQPLEELLQPYYTARQTQKRKMAARVLWSSVHGLCFLEETGKLPLPDEQTSTFHLGSYLIESFIKGIQKEG